MPVLYRTEREGEDFGRQLTNLHLLHLGSGSTGQDTRGGDLIAVFEEIDFVEEDGSGLRRFRNFRTVVARANPENTVDNQSLLYESPFLPNVRLLFASVVQQKPSCILLGQENTFDVNAGIPTTRYWLRSVGQDGVSSDESYFMEAGWDGKPNNMSSFRPLALGGRLFGGTNFAVLCERVVASVPDEAWELVVLSVDEATLTVQREIVLTQRDPTPSGASSFFGQVTMTPFAYAPLDGWLVAYREGNAITGYRIAGDCRTSFQSGLVPRQIGPLPTGASIEQIRIAGGWVRSITQTATGRFSGRHERNYLLVYEVLWPGRGLFLQTLSFTWNGQLGTQGLVSPSPGLGQARQHGQSLGLLDLAADSGTRCHWLYLDRFGDTARWARLGHDGTAHVREPIDSPTSMLEARIAFNHDDDETAYCWIQSNDRRHELVTLHRVRPTTLRPVVARGSGCAQIGPRDPNPAVLLDTNLRAASPIAGHRYFTVTLNGAPPGAWVTLWVALRRDGRLASPDACVFQIDVNDPGSVSFPARADANGSAAVELSLANDALRAAFQIPPEFRDEGAITSWTFPLVAQWTWPIERSTEIDGDDDWWGGERPIGGALHSRLFGTSDILVIPVGAI